MVEMSKRISCFGVQERLDFIYFNSNVYYEIWAHCLYKLNFKLFMALYFKVNVIGIQTWKTS